MQESVQQVLRVPTLASFDRSYHRWNMTHAAAVTIFIVGSQFEAIAVASTAALTIWVAIALPLLFALGYRRHPDGAGPGLPNALTATRAFSAVLLVGLSGALRAGLAPGAVIQGAAPWWLAGALAVITLTDFFDGRIARRMQAGRFGQTWDMECDAAYALGLSLLLRTMYQVPLFVLAIGLMRYLYVLVWHYDGDPERVPRIYKLYAKTVTALLVSGLIVSLIPTIPQTERVVLLAVLLALQSVSFVWDLILQRRSIVRSQA